MVALDIERMWNNLKTADAGFIEGQNTVKPV